MVRYSFLLCLSFLWLSSADFRVPRRRNVAVDTSGEQQEEVVDEVEQELVRRLITNSGADSFLLPEQIAVNVATVITAARRDPETNSLLMKMKQEGNAELQAFRHDLTPDMIVSGLAETLLEMEALEKLLELRNPAQAVAEMEEEGLLPTERVQEYKEKPELLLDDMRKHLYFTFVSLATAGGYL